MKLRTVRDCPLSDRPLAIRPEPASFTIMRLDCPHCGKEVHIYKADDEWRWTRHHDRTV